MRLLLTIALMLASSTAFAHVGVGGTSSFMAGFSHPLGGMDHILAMVAVGLFAANLGGRAVWAVPLSFMGAMALGGVLGIAGIAVPFVEAGIALSIVALGAALALKLEWPLAAAMALVAAFAIFHGHAHGAEMPLDASGAAYAAGFIAATGLLHLAGLGLGLAIGWIGRAHAPRAMQAGGAAIAVAGFGVMAGIL